jgi:hypothetical protein
MGFEHSELLLGCSQIEGLVKLLERGVSNHNANILSEPGLVEGHIREIYGNWLGFLLTTVQRG